MTTRAPTRPRRFAVPIVIARGGDTTPCPRRCSSTRPDMGRSERRPDDRSAPRPVHCARRPPTARSAVAICAGRRSTRKPTSRARWQGKGIGPRRERRPADPPPRGSHLPGSASRGMAVSCPCVRSQVRRHEVRGASGSRDLLALECISRPAPPRPRPAAPDTRLQARLPAQRRTDAEHHLPERARCGSSLTFAQVSSWLSTASRRAPRRHTAASAGTPGPPWIPAMRPVTMRSRSSCSMRAAPP